MGHYFPYPLWWGTEAVANHDCSTDLNFFVHSEYVYLVKGLS